MAGSQLIIEFRDSDSYSNFLSIILDRVNQLLEMYECTVKEINHIIVTLIPVNYSYINKFKVVGTRDFIMDKFITDNFTKKTIIPVSVNPFFLGDELHKVVS